MAGFTSGSAWAMAKDIGEGFANVTERTFRQMAPPQLGQLAQEIERLLRELRGGSVANEPIPDLQARQRKIQRLNGALTVLRSFRQRVKR